MTYRFVREPLKAAARIVHSEFLIQVPRIILSGYQLAPHVQQPCNKQTQTLAHTPPHRNCCITSFSTFEHHFHSSPGPRCLAWSGLNQNARTHTHTIFASVRDGRGQRKKPTCPVEVPGEPRFSQTSAFFFLEVSRAGTATPPLC